jgi:hypothetical protein
MNKSTLSEIYLNGAPDRSKPGADVDQLDIDQLIAQVPRSSLQRDLIRFARDLEPESVALSANLESVLNGRGNAHRHRPATRRSAQGRRHWRIASALAASLIAAVALWNAGTFSRSHVPMPTSVANDRIFSGLNDSSVATQNAPGRDEIFKADFRADEIFNASRNKNG